MTTTTTISQLLKKGSEMIDDKNGAIDDIHDEVSFYEEKEIEEISNGAIVMLLSCYCQKITLRT